MTPRGDKSAYTAKQKRQAEHIEQGYEQKGVPEQEAEKRAWATVNKTWGGGLKKRRGVRSRTSAANTRASGNKGSRNATSRAAQKTGR